MTKKSATVNPYVMAIVKRHMPAVINDRAEGMIQGAEKYMDLRQGMAIWEGRVYGFFEARKAMKELEKGKK